MQLDVDDICALLQYLRSREGSETARVRATKCFSHFPPGGFTDAQMDDLRQAFWQSEPKDEDRLLDLLQISKSAKCSHSYY